VGKIKVYSPSQVAVGSFCGGPFAAVYLLWKNFQALGRSTAARQTLIWGVVFLLAMFASLPLLPDSFPNYAIPVAYALAAGFVADKYQMSKAAVAASAKHDFHSNWNVAGVSIIMIVSFFTVALAWMLGLYYFDLIKID
jgi:hypothetical protein